LNIKIARAARIARAIKRAHIFELESPEWDRMELNEYNEKDLIGIE
jgi:hypothetical protein